ncbi:MAG: hypothetical protein U0746_22970 [Gemmataceae bacterium]
MRIGTSDGNGHLVFGFKVALAAALSAGLWNVGRLHAYDESPADTHKALTSYLRHQEGLVRSAVCKYEVIASPTKPEMIALLRDHWRERGDERKANNNIVPAARARNRSYRAEWWREGLRERLETTSLDASRRGNEITAFDGQIVRRLGTQGTTPAGKISSAPTDSWLTEGRIHPLYLVHVFQDITHSNLVENGRDYRSGREATGAGSFVVVSMQHPTIDRFRFELLLDEQRRIVERRVIAKAGNMLKQDVIEIHKFGDFRSHDTGSGEPIWFPHHAVISYYAGRHANGALMEWTTHAVTIKDIQFNVDIPDERFTLQFPANAEVWDDLTGQGYLAPGVQPETVIASVKQKSLYRRLAFALVTSALACTVVATIVIAWRRRKRARAAA